MMDLINDIDTDVNESILNHKENIDKLIVNIKQKYLL